ncbi:S8 family peptidase [Streptomyces sp. NPDC002187]|uniref:S8 family peptidase n=1 Tax=Streptomyces sp. NPDC002187 TaxID=3364637 RepID=UPI00367BE2D8
MRKRTRFCALVAAAVTTAVMTAAATLPAAAQSDPAPVPRLAPLHRSANAVPGHYIVRLSKTVAAAEVPGRFGVKPLFTYTSAMRGFAAALNPSQLQTVRRTPGVMSVEEDAKVTAFETGGGVPRARAASWGLDRIDQRSLPLSGSFTASGDGQGTLVYILDTGIDYAHAEFGGRAVFGYDSVGDGRRGADCNGHGTHVAGTVGGSTYGVARKATLVSVRVLSCEGSGSWSGVIAGFDWVASNAQQPAVLNASLGGGRSFAVNSAATAVADSGVLPVVAAGNSSQDACQISPASAERAVTVGATNRSDKETDFSNYGACLSLYAPGASIVSARLGGGARTLSGTSMASPHVAGVAALYKSAHPAASVAEVADWLADQSTKDVVAATGDSSPNRLLFTAGL